MVKKVTAITKDSNNIVDVREYFSIAHVVQISSAEFLSPDEIVDDLPNRMDSDTLDEIMKTPEDDLIQFHMGLGMWIRNNYGLWWDNNPFTTQAALHPDDVSFNIIVELWSQLNNISSNKTDPYDQAMSVI